MSKLPNQGVVPTKAQKLEQKYNNASISLYIIALLTVINIVSLLFGGSFYFLVSSSVPYLLVALGMLFCGMFPEEEYVGELANLHILDKSVFPVFVVIAFAIIVLYILSAFFAKNKKVGWLIFALVFFCVDTLLMFWYYGVAIDIIVDIAFHIYVIVSLSIGINAHYQLAKIYPEEQSSAVEQANAAFQAQTSTDSPVLRQADFSVKSKTLLEVSYLNHTILYRRVKRVNELIIDGKVYAEYKAFMEFSHSLIAVVDGHTFMAGLENTSKSFIAVDGILLKEKIRLI